VAHALMRAVLALVPTLGEVRIVCRDPAQAGVPTRHARVRAPRLSAMSLRNPKHESGPETEEMAGALREVTLGRAPAARSPWWRQRSAAPYLRSRVSASARAGVGDHRRGPGALGGKRPPAVGRRPGPAREAAAGCRGFRRRSSAGPPDGHSRGPRQPLPEQAAADVGAVLEAVSVPLIVKGPGAARSRTRCWHAWQKTAGRRARAAFGNQRRLQNAGRGRGGLRPRAGGESRLT